MNIQSKILVIVSLIIGGNSLIAMQNDGKNALHYMARDCDSGLTDILGREAAYFVYLYEEEDNDGNIPLHEAAAYGCLDNVKSLLRFGSDINARNKKGETPLDKAHYFKKTEVENHLKAQGGRYNNYKDLN